MHRAGLIRSIQTVQLFSYTQQPEPRGRFCVATSTRRKFQRCEGLQAVISDPLASYLPKPCVELTVLLLPGRCAELRFDEYLM